MSEYKAYVGPDVHKDTIAVALATLGRPDRVIAIGHTPAGFTAGLDVVLEDDGLHRICKGRVREPACMGLRLPALARIDAILRSRKAPRRCRAASVRGLFPSLTSCAKKS